MNRLGDDPKVRALLNKAQRFADSPPIKRLTETEKYALLESCRQGTAPQKGALHLAVGRQGMLEMFDSDLTSVSGGRSSMRVLNGVYGMGKTFVLRLLQERAMARGFAVSFVTITARECPLYDLGIVYKNIVGRLRTKDCADRPALEPVLASWAQRVRDDVTSKSAIPFSVRKLGSEFQTALAAYYDAENIGDGRRADVALRWLQAENPDMRSARALGLRNKVTNDNALEMLGNLTWMLRYLGLRGLVILMDEADAIPTITDRARRTEAYSNLQRLSNLTSKTPCAYFVYVTTPGFVEASLGAVPRSSGNSESGTVALESLRLRDLQTLATTIRELHQDVLEWTSRPNLTPATLRKYTRRYAARWSVFTTRDFVRDVVAALDVCYEEPTLSLDELQKGRP